MKQETKDYDSSGMEDSDSKMVSPPIGSKVGSTAH